MSIRYLLLEFSSIGILNFENLIYTLYVVDSGAGKLLMVSRVAALIKFLKNLWKFLTGFHLTCEEPGNINDTITRTQEYYSFLEEATLRVQQIKGTAAQTQGPDGTVIYNSRFGKNDSKWPQPTQRERRKH